MSSGTAGIAFIATVGVMIYEMNTIIEMAKKHEHPDPAMTLPPPVREDVHRIYNTVKFLPGVSHSLKPHKTIHSS